MHTTFKDDDPASRDIFLLDLETGSELAVIEHPADDQLFGWTPDGQRVIFASDRTSRQSLWMVEVAHGVPQASPQALLDQFEGGPVGFTQNGSFYYRVNTAAANVYIGTLDPTGAQFESEPRLASSRHVGSAMMADWSPDGSFLVYRAVKAGLRTTHHGQADWIFVLYSVETSQERILTPSFRPNTRIRGPRWSPDGRSLLVWGIGQESGGGLYTVDAETGTTTPIPSDRKGRWTPSDAVWSPDRKSIYVKSGTNISRLDPVTGRETELYQGKGPRRFDLSPDGLWLAFYQDRDLLVVMPSAGGELREVVRWDQEPSSTSEHFVKWMPDSEHLLYPDQDQLWKVNMKTGQRQRIGPTIRNLIDVAVHPDGRQIAFTTQQAGVELWVIENFLPD